MVVHLVNPKIDNDQLIQADLDIYGMREARVDVGIFGKRLSLLFAYFVDEVSGMRASVLPQSIDRESVLP